MAKIIAISNQKGGVGKTTTAVNLSSCLAVLEKKVLLIDLDPQANATSSLGVENDIIENGIYQLFEKSSSASDCINETTIVNLDIIPSHIDLVGIEIESIDLIDREHILMNAINKIEKEYDYIIIDCPPSLGLLTINALTASNSVIIPIQCEYSALEGLGKLLNTIKSIQKIHNKNLILKVFCTNLIKFISQFLIIVLRLIYLSVFFSNFFLYIKSIEMLDNTITKIIIPPSCLQRLNIEKKMLIFFFSL